MGDSAFENMTADLLAVDARTERRNSVTEAEYSEWKRAFTFEGIKGLRYGQSFCNHFGIVDYVLFYRTNWVTADLHIRMVYLAKP